MKLDIDTLEKNVVEMNEKITTAKELIAKLTEIEGHISKATAILSNGYENFDLATKKDTNLKQSIEKSINEKHEQLTASFELYQKSLSEIKERLAIYLEHYPRDIESLKEEISESFRIGLDETESAISKDLTESKKEIIEAISNSSIQIKYELKLVEEKVNKIIIGINAQQEHLNSVKRDINNSIQSESSKNQKLLKIIIGVSIAIFIVATISLFV